METESRPIKGIGKVDTPITASTWMESLTGSRLVQNENVGRSDDFQTDAKSSHLSIAGRSSVAGPVDVGQGYVPLGLRMALSALD